jgi:hypothetical protein
LKQPALPLSNLHLQLEPTSSNFRRLPGSKAITNFQPNPFVKGQFERMDLLPDPHNALLGPPRPPPNHPVLHDLCMKAERYIVERCCELQDETMAGIIGIIAKNTERYYKMEEAIRSETEYLYETFRDTNPECREPNTKRRGSGLGKAKSRSASREPVQRNFSPPPKGHPSIQSVISAVPKLKLKGSWNRDPADDLPEASDAEMTVPPPFGGSLLTKSLSAHRQSAAQATQGSSRVAEESLSQEFGQTLRLDKTKDQRAVAMSHVFSTNKWLKLL